MQPTTADSRPAQCGLLRAACSGRPGRGWLLGVAVVAMASTVLASTIWTTAVLATAVLTSTVLVAVDGRSRFGGAGPTELAESSWSNRAGRTELAEPSWLWRWVPRFADRGTSDVGAIRGLR